MLLLQLSQPSAHLMDCLVYLAQSLCKCLVDVCVLGQIQSHFDKRFFFVN